MGREWAAGGKDRFLRVLLWKGGTRDAKDDRYLWAGLCEGGGACRETRPLPYGRGSAIGAARDAKLERFLRVRLWKGGTRDAKPDRYLWAGLCEGRTRDAKDDRYLRVQLCKGGGA